MAEKCLVHSECIYHICTVSLCCIDPIATHNLLEAVGESLAGLQIRTDLNRPTTAQSHRLQTFANVCKRTAKERSNINFKKSQSEPVPSPEAKGQNIGVNADGTSREGTLDSFQLTLSCCRDRNSCQVVDNVVKLSSCREDNNQRLSRQSPQIPVQRKRLHKTTRVLHPLAYIASHTFCDQLLQDGDAIRHLHFILGSL